MVECKKFFLAHREYEENKVEFLTRDYGTTKVTLDCGRLYSKGSNSSGQCGIGSEEKKVTGPRLIRLPPVLQVWRGDGCWFANTTRGLYAWGLNSSNMLGIGKNQGYRVRQPRRVEIDRDVLDVSTLSRRSYIKTSSGWYGCGEYLDGDLGFGH